MKPLSPASLLIGSAWLSVVLSIPLTFVVVEGVVDVAGDPAARLHAALNPSNPEVLGKEPIDATPIHFADDLPVAAPCHDKHPLPSRMSLIGDYFRGIINSIGSDSTPEFRHKFQENNDDNTSKFPPYRLPEMMNKLTSPPTTDEVHRIPFMPGPIINAFGEIPPSRPKPSPVWVRRRRPRSFVARIHRALLSLSPWEGRAVSFVIGCGIGVLLRMVWVFALLALRAIRMPRRIQLTTTSQTGSSSRAERSSDAEASKVPLLEREEFNEKVSMPSA